MRFVPGDLVHKRKYDEFDISPPVASDQRETYPHAKRSKTLETFNEDEQPIVTDLPDDLNESPTRTTSGQLKVDILTEERALPVEGSLNPATKPQISQSKTEVREDSPLFIPEEISVTSVLLEASQTAEAEKEDDEEEERDEEEGGGGEEGREDLGNEEREDEQRREERLTDSNTEHAPLNILGFFTRKLHAGSSHAYGIEHHEASPRHAAEAWYQLKPRQTILNDEEQLFRKGDIVDIEFENPPHGVGKLVEIREGSEHAAVVQWLYHKDEARVGEKRLTTAQAKPWLKVSRLQSNHFDVVFGANIRGLRRHLVVNDVVYWDLNYAKVTPLRQLQRQMKKQLGWA